MKHEEISFNTKKKLSEALKSAMGKKPFRKITVSELIREGNINRKTFYYHFNDIYDLLKWTFEQDAIEVVKSFDLLVDYREAINFVLDYVESNEYIIQCAFDSVGRDELKRFFYLDFIEISSSVIEGIEAEVGKKLDTHYKKFLTSFYMEAVVGMLIQWIKSHNETDRETVVRYISATIRESLTAIIENQNSSPNN